MKSKLIVVIALIISSITIAQSKVGTVNSEFIIGKMPQMKLALERVSNYGKQLDSTFQIKATDYKIKVDAYNAVEKTLSDTDKKTKIKELQDLEQELGKFRQNGTTMMKLRREEFMRPLYKKVNELISEIAKAEGYTQVLTTSGNEFAFIDDRFDITKKVLDKLGITE
ncbi:MULTISPECIES: OmpH family outer membrane protein [Tenacibaculum]|uniref:OmpH family outer membrane protein n=1 Tax=Tenacibaculum TaxID=104267 RepID=UPI001F0A80ED|nr:MULTISPECIES: OmpH family outer membrane protein [Tenacibaculum]MCH3882126.1 OmpH family outer membrane protein [Tenacibaculum aquimarinum]MCH3885142.1 OmpH family outer membrane protein [Tenacibaculum aquimarinum]MDO6599766.1 OmpH family outer membrane protein [Tenacibaculum sp. 1_MG-2023]